MELKISEQVAVVTGAGSGIGRAIALELARRGAQGLVLVDRSAAVEQLAADISRAGGTRALAFVGDTTEESFRQRVFAEATQRVGPIRVCVPAAGITRDRLAVRLDKVTGKPLIYPLADFRLTVEVNLIAPVYWALETVAAIAEQRRREQLARWQPEEGIQGVIIFIGSVSSQGNQGQIAYAATKAGLNGAAATLTKEAIFYGVRCMLIHPGFTDTPMVQTLGDAFIREHILPFTQLRRLIKPEEIADAVCFMISNPAVSGELWADAGWHPRA